jgi:hypothetical protein
MDSEDVLEIPNTTENLAADVAAVRQTFMAGLCSVETLAAAIGKSHQSIRAYMREGMPVIHYGGTPWIPIEQAKAWLIGRKNNAA